MEITEKVAYLKGLAEGLGLDGSTKEGKILSVMIDVLDDIALELQDLQDAQEEMEEGLDAVSEERLYDTIFQELSDKTVFYVTHRLSAAVGADKVLVFREGMLAEHGSHAELMRLGGLYAEMFRKQAESYLA